MGEGFHVERELGGGGMARVFVAEEIALDRRVVVKVLPQELSGSVTIARFRREIALAARLQHPHIVPLLSAGEVDGLPYYVMPYVGGDSLRSVLAHGEMPIAQTISVLRDVARALEFAHGKSTTHRDIKPDNVLLAGTSAVITDFGIAKALSEATSGGPLTSVGVALGTPAYMAPEQAAADPATDHRADIYAFGAMAYEMLAGHPPFAGRSAQGMLAAHATEAPPAITALRPTAPPRLAELVMRCLEKRPADRPQNVSEILQVLDTVATTSGSPAVTPSVTDGVRHGNGNRLILLAGVVVVMAMVASLGARRMWWQSGSASAQANEIRTIAVLPFENQSGDTTFDYLEDGITDNVRDALNALPELTVKARGSSRQLKGRDAKAVGSTLGVGAVLQGTVSRSRSHLHVAAELVRASDDVSLWSGTFDGEAKELAGMQDTIVRAIVGKLRLATMDARVGARVRGTSNIDAYEVYLKARHAGDALQWGKASSLYRQAIALDSRFARAHGALAISYSNEPTIGIVGADSMNPLALASAKQAIALDPTIAEAYVAEGNTLLNDMDIGGAVRAIRKAYTLDSSNTDVLAAYGASLLQTGRLDEGLAQLEHAHALDPLGSTITGLLAYAFVLRRQYEEGVAMTKTSIVMDPTNVLAHQGLGFTYAFAGRSDSAVRELRTAFRIDSTVFGRRSNLVFAHALAGEWAEASRQRLLMERERGVNSPNYYRLIAALAFGENDAAMVALERGVAAKEPLFGIPSIACDPLFDPLKRDKRFEGVMRTLGARACPASGNWPIRRMTQ
ncbi:MAG: protein kinase [Gemmatimonadaceae bacterium]